MANVYEKDLAQKSSLTTNDFIRVVGSDNVSYKQNVSNVNSTIPLALVSGLTTEALIDQAYITAHTETPDGTLYRRLMYHAFAHSILGGGVFYLEGYRASSSYGWQRITSYGNPTRIFTRSINNGTWTTWAKEPTRAEIDNAHRYKGSITIDDYNDITDTGFYYAKGKGATLNPPLPSVPGRYYQLLVTNTDGLITQFATAYLDPSTIYSRISADGSTWTAWAKQPTRAEITAVTPLNLGNTVNSMLSALQSVWNSGGQIVLFTCGSSLTNMLTKGQASVSGKGIVTLLGNPSGDTTNIDFLLYTGAMELFTARYSTASSSIDIAKKATMTNL